MVKMQSCNHIYYSKIEYIYSAAGQKLLMKHTHGDTTLHFAYAGSLVYKKEYINASWARDYLLTGEGRAVENEGTWDYQYFLTDHLGNTRVVAGLDNTGRKAEAKQTNDYYPFGMQIARNLLGSDNLLKYNGKELQEFSLNGRSLDWYDYGARFYQADLGRWHVMDAMSEDAYSWSPYNYTFNNPISLIDPDGNFPMFGGSYLVNSIADGLSSMGAERASGFVRTYGNALIIDPLANAVDLVSSVSNGNYGDAAKQMDPTGLSSIPDAVQTVKAAANGDKEVQGSVAAGALIVVANAKQGVKSLKSTNTSSTFRFDTRSPKTIKAEGGFKSWGKNMNLSEHASGKSIQNKTSGYVSTAKTEGAATTYAGGRKGYMYELKPSSKGVDVNKSLGKSSPFPNEIEIAVPRKIPADNILNSKPINQ